MSTAHCPGPYTNRHFNRSGSIDIDAGAHKLARVYCRELPGGVCTDEAIAEAEATANLLCAAPELLESLDNVSAALETLIIQHWLGMSEGDRVQRDKFCQEARQLVKKARGL